MFITEISLKRPVFAVMMMVALIVIGIFAFIRLPIEDLPNVEFPIAVINITYPGSSPEVMEKEVVKKLEEAVNPIQGVKRITSTIYEGLANIVIEFKLERSKDAALQDVRDAVARQRQLLPEDIEEPVVRDYDPTSVPIVSLALTSEDFTVSELSTLAKENIKRKLENSYGVGQVSILGNLDRQINVNLDPIALKEKGIGVQQIVKALTNANQELPAGEIEAQNLSEQIRVKGKIADPQNFRNVVIVERNRIPIELQQIADIDDGVEEAKSKALLNNKAIVAMDIIKIRGSNTVEVAKSIKKRIKEINTSLPIGTKLFLTKDNSTSIEDSVHELISAMILGIILTVFIVYVFLNSWRSTVITGLTLPVSLIAAFGVMAAFGFSLNTMTLIALSLSIGLVIDDAIVVRENIMRHLDMGKNHFQAALEGTKEIGLAVIATTLSIVAVFVPVAFMGGITGKFFKEFGITVSAAVLVSLFVSFTLDPMLSSIWIEPREHTSFIGKTLERFNQSFNSLAKAYRKSIHWVLEHRLLTSFITLIIFIGSCMLIPKIGVSFVPDQDRAQIRAEIKGPVNATLDYTTRKTQEVIKFLRKKYPEIIYIYSSIGGGFTGEKNRAVLSIRLVPKKERQKGQEEIMKDMRHELASIAGIKAYISPEGKGGPGGSPIQISIQGDNQKTLEKLSTQVMSIVKATPGATDLDSSLEQDRLNLNINIDRQKASDLGLDLADVSQALRYIFAGQKATTWQDEEGEEYEVIVRLPKILRSSEKFLPNTYFVSSLMTEDNLPVLIPLEAVATIKSGLGPSKISHRDLTREILITGGVQDRSVGEVMVDIKTQIGTSKKSLPILNLPGKKQLAWGKEIQKKVNFSGLFKVFSFPGNFEIIIAQKILPIDALEIPLGYQVLVGGEDEDIQEASSYAAQALVLAIIFIYLIMASQFNSFIQPFAIMFTLPLALIGVFITLFLTGDTLNLLSMIGIITLMGLVTKNGILLIDFANQRRQDGVHSLNEALAEAGEIRLRPIIMTSLAAALGILPLAIGLGAGSELRAPMARAIVGGVTTSTILTLFVIPVVYSSLEDLRQKMFKTFLSKKN
jgi:hydrophobic/amphiphilic exporter-1 (mainly G- bacteria), HAE1 family